MGYDRIELLVEEWKANIDLLKWHDDLKRHRFRNFVTIELALFGGYAVALDYASRKPPFAHYLAIIAVIGIVIAVATFLMDIRAALYIHVVRQKLEKLEEASRTPRRNHGLTTITELSKALNRPPSWKFVLWKSADETHEALARLPFNPAAAVVERWTIVLIATVWIYLLAERPIGTPL